MPCSRTAPASRLSPPSDPPSRTWSRATFIGFSAQDLGFRARAWGTGLGFRIEGFRGLGFRVWVLGSSEYGIGCKV